MKKEIVLSLCFVRNSFAYFSPDFHILSNENGNHDCFTIRNAYFDSRLHKHKVHRGRRTSEGEYREGLNKGMHGRLPAARPGLEDAGVRTRHRNREDTVHVLPVQDYLDATFSSSHLCIAPSCVKRILPLKSAISVTSNAPRVSLGKGR